MDKTELKQKIQTKLPESSVSSRLGKIIVSRAGAHVLVIPSAEGARVGPHTPLAWFLPGIILGALVSTFFRGSGYFLTFASYFFGVLLGGILYATLKKREIAALRTDVESAIRS